MPAKSTVNCPSCSKQYAISEEMRGRKVICKACDTKFAIAAPEPITAELVALPAEIIEYQREMPGISKSIVVYSILGSACFLFMLMSCTAINRMHRPQDRNASLTSAAESKVVASVRHTDDQPAVDGGVPTEPEALPFQETINEILGMTLEKVPSARNGDPRSAFYDPLMLCDVLADKSLRAHPWNPDAVGWIAGSDFHELHPTPLKLATNVAYYVEAESKNKVRKLTMILNVNEIHTREHGLAKLADATEALIDRTSFEAEPSFISKVRSGTACKFIVDGVHYELELHNDRIEWFRVIVGDEYRRQAELRLEQKLAELAKPLVTRCRTAISDDLKYDAAVLRGDGQPIREDGYLSFLFVGENKDQFFIAAFPGGKYRVKAAYGGKYPFKYVASGRL